MSEHAPTGAPKPEQFSKKFLIPPNPKNIEKIQEEIENAMKNQGWTDDDIGLSMFGLFEALTNSMTHGTLGLEKLKGESQIDFAKRAIKAFEDNPNATPLQMIATITPNELRITIKDSGKGFDHAKSIDESNLPNVNIGGGQRTNNYQLFFR